MIDSFIISFIFISINKIYEYIVKLILLTNLYETNVLQKCKLFNL